MAVIRFEEKSPPTASVSESGMVSYQRKWLVQFDDRSTAGPNAAIAAIPVQRGDAYSFGSESNSLSIAMGLTAEPLDDSGLIYVVTIDYGHWIASPDNTLTSERNWDFDNYEEAIIFDADGKIILNSAGDPFPEPITVQKYIPVLTVKKSQLTFDYGFYHSYIGCCNSDYFYGAAPGQVRCTNISAQEKKDASYGTYYDVTYQFQFGFFNHGKGWDKVVLQAGYNHLVEIPPPESAPEIGKTVKKTRIRLRSEVSNDVHKLDANGMITNTPTYKTIKVYNRVPFNSLGV